MSDSKSSHFQQAIHPILLNIISHWLTPQHSHADVAKKIILGLETRELAFCNENIIQNVPAAEDSLPETHPDSLHALELAKSLGFIVVDTNFETHVTKMYFEDDEMLGMMLDVKDTKRCEWHENNEKRLTEELRGMLLSAHERQLGEQAAAPFSWNRALVERFAEKYPAGKSAADAIGKSLHHALSLQQQTDQVLQWRVDAAYFMVSGGFMQDVLELLLEGVGLHFDLCMSSDASTTPGVNEDQIDLDKPLVFHMHPEITNDVIRACREILQPFSQLKTVLFAGKWEHTDLKRLNYEPVAQGWLATLKSFFTRLFGL